MMQDWFRKAKLGIFIHYGIYAVGDVSESWSFHNGNISYEDYMKQCDGFTASKFDARAWADLFRRAGAQYVVMTSKHHDGVALFDTKYSDLNVLKKMFIVFLFIVFCLFVFLFILMRGTRGH